MAAFTPPPPIPDEDQGDASGGTPVRLLNYGPIVNEFHHAAMYGPNGNKLLPSDVAASPNLGYPLGTILDLGDGVQRRVADWSYRSPGVPTYNTIELRDRIANGHAIATPTPQVKGGFTPPPPIPDADQGGGAGPASAQPVVAAQSEAPAQPEPPPPKNPDPYAKELDAIAKNLATSADVRSQRGLEDLAARMPDFQQRQEAASQFNTQDKITKAIATNLAPMVADPIKSAYEMVVPQKSDVEAIAKLFTNPREAFRRDPVNTQDYWNQVVGLAMPFVPAALAGGLALSAAGIEGIRARLSKGKTEGAEAAAPAENPASAQSTILESATQPEPTLDVKGTTETARFQGEEPPPSTADITRRATEWQQGLLAEGEQLGRQADLLRQAGQPIPGVIADRIAAINEELHQGFTQPARQPLNRMAADRIGAEIPVEEDTPPVATEESNGQTAGANGSPVEHGEFGQEGYTAVEPKPQGNGAAPYGGANIGVQEQRPIQTPSPGTILGREKATALGNQWLNRGGDINKVIADFKKTRKVSEIDMGKMNAMLERIQAVTNQAGDALRNAPQNTALKAAMDQALAREQAFTDAYKPMHTAASGSLATLQGTVPLTPEMAASYTGLRRQFGELRGKDFNGEAHGKAVELSKKQSKANAEYRAANDELIRRADTEYGRIRTKRKGPPKLEDIGRTFGEGLKEVCDV